MDTAKRERLEQAGLRVGTVAEFLGLTPEESEMVEVRVALNAADMTRNEPAGVIAARPGRWQEREPERG